MRFLYNIFFIFGFLLSAPWYFLKMWRRGHWQRGVENRFGRYRTAIKQALTNRHIMWIHAVSVGEVNICTQLIQTLQPRLPNIKIVVSTTTSTGMGELKKKLPSHIEKIYYPIDRRNFVERALATIHPEVIVLIEAEIWPNFLWRALDLEIPLFLVNARLSKKSYRGYRFFSFLFRPIFRKFSGVGCPSESDRDRLRTLGFRPSTIHVVGDLKYDAAKLEERRMLDVRYLLQQLGAPPQARLLLGGSTHAGEEAILARIFLRLRPRFPDLFLVLVPRHFERGKEVGRELDQLGVNFIYRSEITGSTRRDSGSVDCLLVNTTGELKFFYEEAAVIFVGKSLMAQGGQNPIEPGALGKAMVFGPNMQNFSGIAESFVKMEGAVQVQDETELEKVLGDLLNDPARCEQLGKNALRVVKENQGAIERTVNMIVEHFGDGEMHVAS
ncbi:MAG: 3-deoxy-D-manno-octulosonic acid transferase [Verrucomicrobiota bacterium]|nr:3-deoxy-D-manno-octulosonic acid transferase [Verrucomicrobiota bacterium]